MDLGATLDVTPQSTISTLQFRSEVANTVVNAVLIALTVANINSIVSKLIQLTDKNTFRYSSFLRVFIFHNSDDPALLFSWLRRAYSARNDPLRTSRCRINKRRLVAPIAARLVIFIASIGSIAISIPSEKRLKGCDQGDWSPDLQRRQLVGRPDERADSSPVCTGLPMSTNLGSVRTRASYCSVPVFGERGSFERSVIRVRYFPETGILYSGVASTNRAVADGEFVLQATEAYVEWVDARNINYRSLIPDWQWEQHSAVVLDAIRWIVPGCEQVGQGSVDDEGFTIVPVGCNFDVVKVSQVADAFIRNSLRWERSESIAERLVVHQGFRRVQYCAIDISVSRPIVNMLPLTVLLVLLFAVNLAVSFATLERGEVLEQTFGLVKEVLGHDCTSGAIERSDAVDGVQVAEVKKWVCSGGVAYHEGILKGEGCDEVGEFPKDALVTRCQFSDGSGRRVVNVGEDEKNVPSGKRDAVLSCVLCQREC